MADENIPVQKDGDKPTPEVAAVAKDVQPVEPAPAQKSETEILKEKLEALEKKEERHLQQLRGKDKQIEDLKAKKIAEVLGKEEAPAEEDYTYAPETPAEPKPKMSSNSNLQNQILVKSAISLNKSEMIQAYGTDAILPFTAEVAKQVESEIIAQDPDHSSLAILNPKVWERTFLQLKAAKADEKLLETKKLGEKKMEEQVNLKAQAIIDKEKAKQNLPVIEDNPAPVVDPKKTNIADLIKSMSVA